MEIKQRFTAFYKKIFYDKESYHILNYGTLRISEPEVNK
jgi:hypothetical protein